MNRNNKEASIPLALSAAITIGTAVILARGEIQRGSQKIDDDAIFGANTFSVSKDESGLENIETQELADQLESRYYGSLFDSFRDYASQSPVTFLSQSFDAFSWNKVSLTTQVPENIIWQPNRPEGVDLYFSEVQSGDFRENKIQAHVVIDPDFIKNNEISQEELVFILTVQAHVFDALKAGYDNQKFDYFVSPPFEETKKDLEAMYWLYVAQNVIGPLNEEGKIKSQRLTRIIPDETILQYERQSRLDAFRVFSQSTILPGLSQD